MSDESKIKVGVRVKVTSQTGQIVGLGQVAYFGETDFKSGKWVGVILDEPKGKNNGWVQGKQYFSCSENYGLFVNPDRITVLDDASSLPAATKQRPLAVQESGIPHSTSSSGLATPIGKQATSSTSPSEKRVHSAIPAPVARKRVQEGTPMPSQESTPTGEEPPATARPAGSAIPVVVTSIPQTQQAAHELSPSQDPQAQQRLAETTAQIRDLEEKLETLKIKRAEDRDKLKELERCKLQNQQLTEYKAKMQENFASAQTELFEAQKRYRELQEEFDRYREDTRDTTDVQEMLTMDKELAEEKLEMLQTEHADLQERHDATLKENEALKRDLERLTSRDTKGSVGGSEGEETVTSYQLRQLTEQNVKLKEACVRMRDIAQEDKREAERLRKLVDKQATELGFLQKEKERVLADLDAAQRQIIDLHEQLDASLGADRLVVELSERSATLEDRVRELADENSQLEALCDANDELLEVEREKQQELRSELDRLFVEKFDMKRKVDALAESLAECARTIQQYKAVTTDLQAKLAQTEAQMAQTQPDSGSAALLPVQSQPVALGMPQALDFHARFIEQQAFAKTIEIDLRKIELENANRHVQLLLAYLPDEFLRTGGEHDAMQVCLLVPRLASKANLLAEQARSNFFDAQSNASSEAISSDSDADLARVRRISFANVLVCELQLLAGVLQQFDAALAACTVEQYVRVGTLHAQLTAHETTTVDYLLELLRKDRLDETVSLDGLHKAVNYVVDLYRVQLCAVDAHINGLAELDAFVRAAVPALDGINLDSRKLRALLARGAPIEGLTNEDDQSAESLLAFIDERTVELRDCLKRIRRHVTQLGSERDAHGNQMQPAQLTLPKETAAQLQDAVGELALLVSALHLSVVQASHQTELDVERTGHIPELVVRKLLADAFETVYGTHAATSSLAIALPKAAASARAAFQRASQSLRSIVTALENGEFDSDSAGLASGQRRGSGGTLQKTGSGSTVRPRLPASHLTKTPTFLVRANTFKKGVQAVDELKRKLETVEADAKETRSLVTRKQQECEEMKLRVELAEKKLENAQKSVGERDFWKQMAAEREDQLRKQKEDTDKTLDALQADLDTAERENKDLKEKMKNLSKRNLLENIANVRPTSPACSATAAPVQVQTKVQDSPMLLQQVEALQTVVQQLRQQNAVMASAEMKAKLASLRPLKSTPMQFVPGKFSLDADGRMTDDEKREACGRPEPYAHYAALNSTFKKLGELNYHWLTFCAEAKVIDLAEKESSAWRTVLKRKLAEKEINKECEKISQDAVKMLAQVHFGCTVRTDFREFPSTAFTSFIQKRLVADSTYSLVDSPGKVVEVSNHQLEAIHNRLLKLADVA